MLENILKYMLFIAIILLCLMMLIGLHYITYDSYIHGKYVITVLFSLVSIILDLLIVLGIIEDLR